MIITILSRPDDVLQTVKFGSDVMQQMRAKRNEILMSHATSDAAAKPLSNRREYSTVVKEKTITPTPKIIVDKHKDVEPKKVEKSYPVPGEIEAKLERLQSDVTVMIENHKSSIESKVKEIISTETGELRREFKQDRVEQVHTSGRIFFAQAEKKFFKEMKLQKVCLQTTSGIWLKNTCYNNIDT